MNRKIVLGVAALAMLVTIVGIGVGETSLQSSDGQFELSEERAKAIAESEVNGTAQTVEQENEDGPVYEVHVELSDGSAKELEIDGQSGEVLEIESADDGFLDDDFFGEDED